MNTCKVAQSVRGRIAVVLLSGIIVLGAGESANARAPLSYHFERICTGLRIGGAECAGLARRPRPLTVSQAGGQVERTAEDAPTDGSTSVLFKHPLSGALSPQAIQTAYALPTATTSSALQTIAVVDAYDDPSAESDLRVYDKQYGLPPCTTANGCFRKVNEEGDEGPLPPTEGAWAAEISADIQISHAICQPCRILLVEAKSEEFSDLGTAVNTAVAAGATEVNNSYESEGEEGSVATMLNAMYYDHPGVVITASAGDCGYLGEKCEADGVSFPASSPDVVAVGATAIAESEGTWISRVWSGTGGGCSTVFAAPPWQYLLANWAHTGCGTARLVADVSAVGAPETGVSVYDSTPFSTNTPARGWGADAGTSVSTPIVTGEFALDGGSHGVDYPARTLYSHVGDIHALYDVRIGANGLCGQSSACSADRGYDGPSGVGSPVGLAAFAVVGSPADVVPPSIVGAPEEGQVLVATHGKWSRNPNGYSYRWARCERRGGDCQPIPGATAPSYTVVLADVGATLRVQETASNASGEGAPAISNPTALVTKIRGGG